MKQAELARLMGRSPTDVSRKLRAKRGMKLEEIYEFAKALNVPPYKIIAGSQWAEIPDESERLSPQEKEIIHLLREVEPSSMRSRIARGICSMLQSHLDSDAA